MKNRYNWKEQNGKILEWTLPVLVKKKQMRFKKLSTICIDKDWKGMLYRNFNSKKIATKTLLLIISGHDNDLSFLNIKS